MCRTKTWTEAHRVFVTPEGPNTVNYNDRSHLKRDNFIKILNSVSFHYPCHCHRKITPKRVLGTIVVYHVHQNIIMILLPFSTSSYAVCTPHLQPKVCCVFAVWPQHIIIFLCLFLFIYDLINVY